MPLRTFSSRAQRTERSVFNSYWELLQNKITALQEAARGLEPGGNVASSTRLEVPWVDYLPSVAVGGLVG